AAGVCGRDGGGGVPILRPVDGRARRRTMNVALDVDGTISEHPELFALLSASLRAAGHAVIVLTYRDPERVEHTRTELAGWGITYERSSLVVARRLLAVGRVVPLAGLLLLTLIRRYRHQRLAGLPRAGRDQRRLDVFGRLLRRHRHRVLRPAVVRESLVRI